MEQIKMYGEETFESIKEINEYGAEFWYARDLQRVLGYSKWDNFKNVIEKAKISVEGSENKVSDHFADVGKTIAMPKGASKEIQDIMLSRYACYLIVQNSDPRKEVVALGQTYFAVKTREREVEEELDKLTEDDKRLKLREEMKTHNKSLAEAAKEAGVTNYGKFQNAGYQGLYGGMNMRDIHANKGLNEKEKILDHMGSTELAANLFRATQTDEKIRRENIQGEVNANKTHYQVGAKVRQTMAEISGVMPENLPAPDKGIKDINRNKKKKLK